MRAILVKAGMLLCCGLMLPSCLLNHPYRPEERGENIYYTTFDAVPKTLDPAVAYEVSAYSVFGTIFEPPFQYHYLKRPYELIPLTAEKIPQPIYLDTRGRRLPADAPPGKVHRAVYEIRIRPGISYQPHPCFAKDAQGRWLYHDLSSQDVEGFSQISDFEEHGTRELVAADYVNQIKRMADPRVPCPILSTMEKYILGLREFAQALQHGLDAERARRREMAGGLYNQELNEKARPILLAYDRHPLEGASVVDRYTFRIILKTKYPQILYWLAMPFFAPIPEEAMAFYRQPVLVQRNIILARFPVGTGAYRVETLDPAKEIVLVKNEHYHGETYPSEGEPEDRGRGLLGDAGEPLPFMDRIVMKLEKESIPRWTKFMQGYYDASGIPSESFDRAIQMRAEGDSEVSGVLKERGIELSTNVGTSIGYLGFNMLDDVVGGLDEHHRKLRRAISIAFDMEEYIQIFMNGRGVVAHSNIPPGIFGYASGADGMNPYVYALDAAGRPRRRSLEEARRLLAEAGYPDGQDREGRQLTIRFDNAWTGAGGTARIAWLRKQFAKLGIQMKNETTDWNRFQEKLDQGNVQCFWLGWYADYPDPENFLFLLYGPNGEVKHNGPNHFNYESEEYDRVFRALETMENGPERLRLIQQAVMIMQRDAPMMFGYHPVQFSLYHSWLRNVKPHGMAFNTYKYHRLDPEAREAYRERRNQPVVAPFVGVLLAGIVGTIPAVASLRRRRAGKE